MWLLKESAQPLGRDLLPLAPSLLRWVSAPLSLRLPTGSCGTGLPEPTQCGGPQSALFLLSFPATLASVPSPRAGVGDAAGKGAAQCLGKPLRSRRPSPAGPAGGRLELARNKVSSELCGSSWCFTAGWRGCGVASLRRQHGAAPDLRSIPPPPMLSGFGWIWDLLLCFSFFPFFFCR